MKQPKALIAVEQLERAAAMRLAAAHARLLRLRFQRTALLEKSAAAKQALRVTSSWSAFDCAVLHNHTLAIAAATSVISVARRATLTAGAGIAKEKARWAAARVGLTRRAGRRPEFVPWPD